MPNDVESPVRKEGNKRIKSFKTTKGSIYTYDHEGKTTRFKTITREQQIKQDITVFVELTPDEDQRFQQAIQKPDAQDKNLKVYVLERQTDNSPKIIRNLGEIISPREIYLGILREDQWTLIKQATLDPAIGTQPFDSRHFQKDGGWLTERHLGNKVVEIEHTDN